MAQFIYEITQESGDIIVNANENNLALDPIIKEEIMDKIANIALNRYPENENTEICQTFADHLNISIDEVCVGTGSDAMLCQVITNEIKAGNILYTINPDFSMYDYYVSANEGIVEKFLTDQDGSFDIDEFIKHGKNLNPNLIIFSNPNNPTSHVLTCEQVLKIVKAFPNIKVVIDEAYIDFCEYSVVKYINEFDNLLVTRTMSKAWGMAGIRVGFLIANANYMKPFKAMKVPYNLNSISQVIGTIVLKHEKQYKENIAIILEERNSLYDKVSKLNGIKVYPSNTNYLFGRTDDKEKLLKAFNKAGIVIRNYNDDSFRISIGTHEENAKILEVITSIFA